MSSSLRVVTRAVALALLLGGATGCSAGMRADGATDTGGDDRLFSPEDLPSTFPDGEGLRLTLIALTLTDGADGPELYAAVRNDSEKPVCEGGMTTDFFDKTGALLTSSAGVLQGGSLYRLDGGAGATLSCLDPGALAMTAATELPASLRIDELGHLEHRFPAFVVDGSVPIQGPSVTNVRVITSGGTSTYTGTLENHLDVTLSQPKVTVFPVNRVQRPLGVATGSADIDVVPGGNWSFETGSVSDAGAGFVAYATGSIADST